MSVFNGAKHIDASVESILGQRDVSLELIVVNDGSTDDSAHRLGTHASRDSRLRVLEQPNSGLTRALIRGCAEAQGKYIARQDADDASLPGRLRAQRRLLESSPEVALAGCWTRYVGPEDEDLGRWAPPANSVEATRALRASGLNSLRGLGGHGTAMFRHGDYERAGGYRPQFYYAQDLDLWLRLAEIGDLAIVPEVLYAVRLGPDSISGRDREAQVQTARVILDLAKVRKRGGDESRLLDEAARIGPSCGAASRGSKDSASGLYFIGKLLLDRRDRRSRGYLWKAASAKPWSLRYWVAFLAAAILAYRGPARPESA